MSSCYTRRDPKPNTTKGEYVDTTRPDGFEVKHKKENRDKSIEEDPSTSKIPTGTLEHEQEQKK